MSRALMKSGHCDEPGCITEFVHQSYFNENASLSPDYISLFQKIGIKVDFSLKYLNKI